MAHPRERGRRMIQYDPSIIREQAQNLYNQAERLTTMYAIGLGLLGFIVGGALGVGSLPTPLLLIPASIGAALLAVIGARYGTAKGFALRLQAQTALCQVQIELNGRPQHPSTRDAAR
ncbi:hypothetical protein G6O69_23930 [Pseudenhygromyxa sp. WMMC2535]|uniref:hypothetical protein n=1 Tax=Pseudenhygromyxa sp. WMMC2535 TaxID=2712867 RepID=UPI001596389E|nr:hypothetical protein [Pseudenhygromyxa sp. WMMC2535]NVB40910.1 hypothetical protein [Pseudenhygromyxa sp. WMMC2535]